jgi:eukaryotic-like serine/threonine-protein kinase
VSSFSDLYLFDAFVLDPSRRALLRDGVPVSLSPKAFEILSYFVMNPGRVVTKEELFKAVWPDSFVEESNLAQQISWLRKALGDKADSIVTVPRRGYQFVLQVEAHLAVPAAALVSAPEQHSGEVVIQRVLERTHVVIDESSMAPAHGDSPAVQPASSRVRWVVAAGAVLLLGASWIGWRLLQHPEPGGRAQVVVADFANATGDATFDTALKHALEIDLDQSPYIEVLSEHDAFDTLTLMGHKSSDALTPEIAKEVCLRNNWQVLLAGTISSLGRDYVLTLEATDCNTGKKLASARAEASSKENVLEALDSVADRCRRRLGESPKSVENYQVPIVQETTPSLEALKAYSLGAYLGAQGKDETESLPLYQRAIEIDPEFAMAYGALANDYYNLNEYNLAAQNYRKAFQLSDRVSAREKLILRAHYYAEGQNDLLQGIQVYRLWAATYPKDWVPWVNLANNYTQLGEYGPALEAGKRGLQAQPNRGISYSVLTRAYLRANRFDEAKAVGLQAIERHHDSVGLHSSLFAIAVAQNDTAALAREIEWGKAHNNVWYSWELPYLQANASAASGKYKQAAEFFRRAYATAMHETMPEAAADVAISQAETAFALGLPADARAALERVRETEADSPEAASLRAGLGDPSPGDKLLAAHAAGAAPGSPTGFLALVELRAAVDLAHGRPSDVLQELEAARPYELADYTILTQRATAYLRLKRPEKAANEYRKILANPGVDVPSPVYPLAHVGLARAYAAQNDKTASRKEYEVFFELWKDADADVPVLQQARREYARLL